MTERAQSNCLSDVMDYQFQFPAYSIGSIVAQRAQHQGVIGHIHSVFRHVLNIAFLEGGLGFIVGPEVGRGPLSICVDIPEHIDLVSLGLDKGLIVSRVDDLIVIGTNVLAVSIKEAALWESSLLFTNVLRMPRDIERNLMTLREVAVSSGKHSGLGQLIELSESDLSNEDVTCKMEPVAQLSLPHILRLLKAIKSYNTQNLMESVAHLIGLGPGLTPAGDDLLIGLMLSMLYFAENLNINTARVRNVNSVIISCVHARTTSVSQEFLIQAAIGNANEQILNLIEVLLIRESNDVEQVARTVLAIGGTSGTDTVLGVLLGSYLMLNESTWFRDPF